MRAMMAAVCVVSVACATTQRGPTCGESSPAPPPRVVAGLATADSASGLASAVFVVSELCTGRRIGGATVQFVSRAPGAQAAVTDSAGRAVLRGRAGTQDVRVIAFGFYPDSVAVPLSTTRRDTVFVSLRLARALLDRVRPAAPSAAEAGEH